MDAFERCEIKLYAFVSSRSPISGPMQMKTIPTSLPFVAL